MSTSRSQTLNVEQVLSLLLELRRETNVLMEKSQKHFVIGSRCFNHMACKRDQVDRLLLEAVWAM